MIKTLLWVVAAACLLAACKQSTSGDPSISHASSTEQTKANAAFAAANAAFALAYTNNNDTTGDTSHTGLTIVGTSALANSQYTFKEVVTMTDYAFDTSGIMAADDVTMKGTFDTSGNGSYTYVGDLILEGTVASGDVSLNLSIKTTATKRSYSGTVTVQGTAYSYSGSQTIP